MSVVREFSYVFPDDLLGLLSDRELEFGIELLSDQPLFLYHRIGWHQLSYLIKVLSDQVFL